MKDANTRGSRTILLSVIVAVSIVLVLWFLNEQRNAQKPLWDTPTSQEEVTKAYEYTPDLNSTLIKFIEGVNAWYVNETLRFSFRLPDGFSAPDGKVKGTDTHIVELSNGKGNALHIVATKIKEGASAVLTEEAIRQQVPEENPHTFKVGFLKEGTEGFYFETDSAAAGGEGVAFWFTKDGYLYTLTTTKKDTELLELVMQTWRFGGAVVPPPP